MNIKNKISTVSRILISMVVFVGASIMIMPQITSANTYVQACPFSSAANRTIVNFSTEFVWGKSVTKVTKSVNLLAGDYKVSLQSYDGYADRVNVSQPNESYFVDFESNSVTVARSAITPDLQDNVTNASYSGIVNGSINIPENVNTVTALHANYLNDMGGRNSVTAGCAAFERITPPEPPAELTGSCSVSPSAVNIGNSIAWTATATGGAGSYNYSWTGTDSLYGNSSYVSKVYTSAGNKTGTVTITSGSQSVVRTCNAVVNNNIIVDDNLTVSCSANKTSIDVDESVTWRAYPVGGTGSYSYDWSGTDSLDSNNQNFSWSYDDNGTKYAYITVTSGGQSASASCHLSVNEDEEEEENDDLEVRCYASPSNPQIGVRMNWYARVEGGDGDYDYDWSGTESLNSSSRSPYMTYDYPGSKRATVTVTDGDGEEDTATCYANVNSVLAYSEVNQAPLLDAVYLSQVPYTGVSDNIALYTFIGLLALFSAWIAYIIIERKKSVGSL